VNGEQITVGSPYFDRMTMPIVVCLLFLMAVAPVLPWRKASGELLRKRLFWPAVVAVVVLVACVAAGVRGLNPLLAFGLGAFAGASAGRQVVLATRRNGWRGFVGRANGGMIVHLGVVVIAVGFAASHSFAQQTQLSIKPGQTAHFDGHSFTFLGMKSVTDATHSAVEARIKLDDSHVYAPAVSDYPFASEEIGTPSVHSDAIEDVYLTLASTPATAGGPVVIGVIVEPLVMWIWAGGGIILVGTALAAWPGRRRRPTDPVGTPADAGTADEGDATPVAASVGAAE
jgi:cytochrome c-type biogenesis protein CcmF